MESQPELTTHFSKEEKAESVSTNKEPKKNENGCKKKEKVALENGEKNVESETFWTVCPYCYNLYEYEKAYEECCLRCQNCRRAFHGVAVKEPSKNSLAEGEDEYYCGLGFFSLKYSLNGGDGNLMKSQKKKECGRERTSYEVDTVVEISDDSDDDGGGESMNVKRDDEKDKGDVSMGNVKRMLQGRGKTEVGNEGKKAVTRKNVKSVARKSKKVMGRGMGVKNRRIEAGSSSGTGDGCPDSDLEFFERDGDLFVGIKSSF